MVKNSEELHLLLNGYFIYNKDNIVINDMNIINKMDGVKIPQIGQRLKVMLHWRGTVESQTTL